MLTPSLEKQAIDALDSASCCFCSKSKGQGKAFCSKCYYGLPSDLRKGLWKGFSGGYVDAWDEAREWLRLKKLEDAIEEVEG